MEQLLRQIEERLPTLSKGQKRIAEYIVHSYEQAAFMTASKLGSTVGVSESTVVRFAFELGLDGYPALQSALQELIRYKLTTVQRAQMASGMQREDVLRNVMTKDMHDIRATLDLIDYDQFSGAIDALLSARRVYVLGLRSAMPMAQFLSYYLDYVCDNVMFINGAVQDLRERMVRICDKDVLVGISFPRYSARTVDAMRYAKSRGAQVVALTDKRESPVGLFADYTLCAKSDMASFADSLVAPLSLINALIVAVGLSRQDEAHRHLQTLEEVWGFEGVYMTGDESAAHEDGDDGSGDEA